MTYDIADLGDGVLEHTADNLPTDGSTLYVSLFYKVGSVWKEITAEYTAYTAGAVTAPTITPTAGSTLLASTQVFSWSDNSGGNVTNWWLFVGSAPGASDIYDSDELAAGVTSASVTGLPTDESTVYVRLYYKSSSGYESIDVTYTASSFDETETQAVLVQKDAATECQGTVLAEVALNGASNTLTVEMTSTKRS